MKSNIELLENVGERVNQIIKNSKSSYNIHIEIDAKVGEAPTISYDIDEYIGLE